MIENISAKRLGEERMSVYNAVIASDNHTIDAEFSLALV